MNILIPMAGEGSRFKVSGVETPKPLIMVDDVHMVEWAVKTLNIPGNYIFVTRNYVNNDNNKKLDAVLRKIKPNCKIIRINELTRGAAETCLAAKKLIDNDNPLIITNCDQLMKWDAGSFLSSLTGDVDGSVVTYNSTNIKNSFISFDHNNNVIEVREKTPISDHALVGLHYWKHGSDFVSSAEEMIKENVKDDGEFYIAPTYNFLIAKNKKISYYHLKNNQYISLGTPEDLSVYIGKKNEFKENKPKTIFCDLDGTVLKHVHKYSNIGKIKPELNDGVIEKFDEWDSLGLKIILVTGRKESARKKTEEDLESLGIPYDQLVMNVGNGPRVMINDKISQDSGDRIHAVNVVTDSGFSCVDWKKFKL
tara:strand:- start:24540 stop:25637 length:1098 start_codon:yes stop_codon:yes gene_type:complete